MESFVEIAGLLGLGSLVTLGAQHFLASRSKKEELRKTECKEAFVGFLSAYATYKINPESIENRMNMELWAARVQLVSSKNIYHYIIDLVNKTPKTLTSELTFDYLVVEMRKDLGICE